METFDYITIREAAAAWGLSEKYVQKLCRTGQAGGAVKRGGVWFIPAGAPKPAGRGGGEGFCFRGAKRRVFEAAIRLFAERSYDKVSVSDITGEVGLTQAAFYNHFKSKHDLLETAYGFFEHYYAADRPTIEDIEPILREGSAEEIFASVYYDFNEEYRQTLTVCLKLILQRAFIDERARELFQMLFRDANIEFVASVFDRAVELGRLAPFDTEAFAAYSLTMRCFELMNYLIDENPESQAKLEALQKRMNQYILAQLDS
jgi:AcrR family transcriptional regulator